MNAREKADLDRYLTDIPEAAWEECSQCAADLGATAAGDALAEDGWGAVICALVRGQVRDTILSCIPQDGPECARHRPRKEDES